MRLRAFSHLRESGDVFVTKGRTRPLFHYCLSRMAESALSWLLLVDVRYLWILGNDARLEC